MQIFCVFFLEHIFPLFKRLVLWLIDTKRFRKVRLRFCGPGGLNEAAGSLRVLGVRIEDVRRETDDDFYLNLSK